MLLGNQYNALLNHESHKIKLIMNSKNKYIYNIELISSEKKCTFMNGIWKKVLQRM